MTTCPKCGHEQPAGETCAGCGLVFRKYRPPRPPRGPEEPYDWERFWIHFVCGALAGAFFGGLIWARHWHPGNSGWLVIGGTSLLSALLGGIFGDVWWEMMLRSWRSWGSWRWWW